MSDESLASVPTSSEPEGMIPQPDQVRRLVIGLDYGTTCTGVAFDTPTGNRCTLSDIGVISTWGPQMTNLAKVPSVISYSPPSAAREQQWGKSLSPNAVSMVHTKLELDVGDVAGELDLILQVLDGMKDLDFGRIMDGQQDDIPAYSYKSPEQIVGDYLTKVFQYIDREADKFSRAVRERLPTDIVVTVPSDWSYMAINATYRAVTRAGFNQTSFQLNDFFFMSEPEAAAIYAARHYRDERQEEFLRENRYFILCDAGGGTVDMVSYQVKQLRPTLQLEQIGEPTGRKCGSIFINTAFKKWLKGQINETNYRQIDPDLDVDKHAAHSCESLPMRELMEGFDALKENFGESLHEELPLDLPAPLDSLTIPNVVNQGQMMISRPVMESFFDPQIEQIVNMLRTHLSRIENRGGKPKDLFLVGGFGESAYLHQQIEITLDQWKLKLRRPEKSWTAVVQGAVICGVEKDSIPNLRRANCCRYDYCVRLDMPFSEVYSPTQDIAQTDGEWLAEDQLDWILSKGDLVLEGVSNTTERKITITFLKATRGIKRLPIYRYTDDDERPSRYKNAVDELEEACVLEFDLSQIPLTGCFIKKKFGQPSRYITEVTLVTELTWQRLDACIKWGDTELARSSVLY